MCVAVLLHFQIRFILSCTAFIEEDFNIFTEVYKSSSQIACKHYGQMQISNINQFLYRCTARCHITILINKRCIVNDIIYVTKLTVFNNTTLNFITKYVYAFHKCFNQCLPFHVPNSGRLLIKRLSERMFYNFQSSESILGSLQFGALYTSLKFTITLDMTSSLSNSVMKLSFYVGWL